MLTAEEENTTGRTSTKRDLSAAKQLIHLTFASSYPLHRGYGYRGLNQADLIQEGQYRPDESRQNATNRAAARACFSFAAHWIKAEIHEFILRNWRLVRVATTKPQRKLFFNLRSMRKNLNALPLQRSTRNRRRFGRQIVRSLEMEQRMTGHDIGIMAENDDGRLPPLSTGWQTTMQNPAAQLSKQAHYACKPKVCKTPGNWTTAAAVSLKAAGCKTMAV